MSNRDLMQRRHFQFIADVVRNLLALDSSGRARGELSTNFKRQVAINFANALGVTNNKFNRDRFIRACLDRQPPRVQ